MNKLYYDATNPASYGGIVPLALEAKNGIKSTENWLKTQDAYSLHKPIRKKFVRRKTIAKGINDLFQADLVDMQSLSRFNDNNRFILACVDVFSKKAFAIPLKDKSGGSLVGALGKIFADTVPNMLQTDRGTEFLNHRVQDLLKQYNIRHYWSFNDEIKASCVERWNRSLKSRMYRWIDVLQDLVDSYNKSFHRTIAMAPNDVTPENSRQIAERMYPPKTAPIWKLQIGDHVRITKYKHIFVKGYKQNWSEELFVIDLRYSTTPVTYGLRDLAGEEIKGKFYEEELQKVIKTDQDYIVEKVLKTRKRKGRVEHFVKWQGYADKFNSWTSDLHAI
jgi:Integrase core domain/Chromo (CHRromatin Organisation MOdifier) domain